MLLNDEIHLILINTWLLVDLPPEFQPIDCKCIFRRNIKQIGPFKARLVAKVSNKKNGYITFILMHL